MLKPWLGIVLTGLILVAPVAPAEVADPEVATLLERAEAGDSEAQFELAARYSRGLGVAADPDAAGHWLLRAAEEGHVEARAALGFALLERAENAPEREAALAWLAAAADSGNVPSRLALGQAALEAGRGEEAARHFRMLAEDGHADVQVGLGLLHSDGEGHLPQDPLEALHWFRLAAGQGHPGGQRGLGALLGNGAAGPVDRESAYFWFTLAAAEDAGAARYLEELEHHLDAAQREAIESTARGWSPGRAGPEPRSADGFLDTIAMPDDGLSPAASADVVAGHIVRWRFRQAMATRRAPGFHPSGGETIELLLLSEEPSSRALFRWLQEGGAAPAPASLSLFLDEEARVMDGLMRDSEGYAEVAGRLVDAELRLRHGWLGGRLRLTQEDDGAYRPFSALDVRVLVELQPGGR